MGRKEREFSVVSEGFSEKFPTLGGGGRGAGECLFPTQGY
jgi:hypothetical protein